MNTTIKEQSQSTVNGEHDRFAHYYNRYDLDKAYLFGKQIQAICGKWDCPTRDFTQYQLCGTCKQRYMELLK